MKANAPEKIYRTTFYLDDDKGDTKWKKTPVAGAENIEYVRKDAFIEKAETYLKEQFAKDVSVLAGGVVHINFETAINNFINYMKGEKV
jgi:hypothetical protein